MPAQRSRRADLIGPAEAVSARRRQRSEDEANGALYALSAYGLGLGQVGRASLGEQAHVGKPALRHSRPVLSCSVRLNGVGELLAQILDFLARALLREGEKATAFFVH